MRDQSYLPDNSLNTWKSAYRYLLDNEGQMINSKLLKAWIEPLRVVKIEEDLSKFQIQLEANSDFAISWIKDNYLPYLETALGQVSGRIPEILFSVYTETSQMKEPYAPSETLMIKSSLPINSVPHLPTASNPFNQFDPKYTFESFVVGGSNQFAHASALAVSQKPALQYNPLFIYSPPGLGKTHLLHAIANAILARFPNQRILYTTAERFMNDLIESIQYGKMPQFRNKYRDNYDVLLIDDIQFIAGKEKTEEEFLNTFHTLHSSKKQIVLTSDRPPNEIEGLAERLKSRFLWGLIADIGIPDIETRIAILKNKAEHEDLYLPDDVATFVASHIKSNVRELEGVLIKLSAHCSLTGVELSLELAKQVLKIDDSEKGSGYTVDSIQAAVAKHFKLKSSDFKSQSKTRSVARPRQIAMYLIRKYTSLGFKEIGEYFGGRDHTTVMHACKSIEDKIETEPALKSSVEAVQNLL